VALNKAVIRIRPNRMKTAIAQANLCASYAKLEDLELASAACDAALALRPGLDVASGLYGECQTSMSLQTLYQAVRHSGSRGHDAA